MKGYPTGESAKDVCWKTLVSNNTEGQQEAFSIRKPSNDVRLGFDVLYKLLREAVSQGQGAEVFNFPGLETSTTTTEQETRAYEEIITEFWGSRAGIDRRVFWTKRGYMGLAANDIQVGDEIWVIME